jgi:8-oxo-dGTP diphosphatase
VIIRRKNKILLGKRKGNLAYNSWGFPGGNLEFNETIYECAKREVLEETGLKIKNIHPGTFTDVFFEKQNEHFVALIVIADYISGEAKLLEPDKCHEWKWFTWRKFPKDLSPQ